MSDYKVNDKVRVNLTGLSEYQHLSTAIFSGTIISEKDAMNAYCILNEATRGYIVVHEDRIEPNLSHKEKALKKAYQIFLEVYSANGITINPSMLDVAKTTLEKLYDQQVLGVNEVTFSQLSVAGPTGLTSSTVDINTRTFGELIDPTTSNHYKTDGEE